MLILSESDVASLYDMPTAFEAVSAAATAHCVGQTSPSARTVLHLPEVPAEYLVMPGTVGEHNFGAKIWYSFPSDFGTIPRSSALITLIDPTLGHEVVMAGGRITDFRTGAMTGLVARHMAPEGASVLALFGAGIQARAQAIAVLHAVPTVTTVRVHSRRPEPRAQFRKALSVELAELYPDRSVAVVEEESGQEACAGAGIVVAATTSATPVVSDAWLHSDVLLCGTGSHAPGEREIDPASVARADRIVVDTAMGGIDGAGDLSIPIGDGLIDRSSVRELGDLVRDPQDARSGLSVFKSVGFGAADVVSAYLVARKAIEIGRGTHVALHV